MVALVGAAYIQFCLVVGAGVAPELGEELLVTGGGRVLPELGGHLEVLSDLAGQSMALRHGVNLRSAGHTKGQG